jgi:hypothetical protein
MPPACKPPGSRVVDGSVVRWHRVTWFCATHPRRLVALPLPKRSLYVRHVVARGRFLAFSYLQDDPRCDNYGIGARSIYRDTGGLVFTLPVHNLCTDIYSERISDVALRPFNGAFAVISHVDDLEDDLGSAEVVTVSSRGRRVIDAQDKREGDERLNPSRIIGGSLYYDGRLRYRRADGRVTARL